ncbi:MAG TPA: GGDEF domain-containing protein [Chthonomonadaceae bacterium]|nr:GGDEF domain-containing protein [Chthonomonadaceae bacterium]
MPRLPVAADPAGGLATNGLIAVLAMPYLFIIGREAAAVANWGAGARMAWTSAGLAAAALAFCSAACAITRLRSGRDQLTRRLQEADELQRIAGQVARANSSHAAADAVLRAIRGEIACDLAVLVPRGAGPDRPSWRAAGGGPRQPLERIDYPIDSLSLQLSGDSDREVAQIDATNLTVRALLPGCLAAALVPVATPDGGPAAAILLGFASPIWPGSQNQSWLRELAAGLAGPLEQVFAHDELRRLAFRDPMTGLANYRAFRDLLAEETGRAVRYGHPLSLLLVDVDRFKRVNDGYGHPAGDEVLRHVARVLQEHVRAIDTPARYGGEEFAVLCPETEVEAAVVLADRLRAALEASPCALPSGELIRVTMSVGVAVYPSDALNESDLIAAADEALYEAKRAGRNRVISSPPRQAPVQSTGPISDGLVHNPARPLRRHY